MSEKTEYVEALTKLSIGVIALLALCLFMYVFLAKLEPILERQTKALEKIEALYSGVSK